MIRLGITGNIGSGKSTVSKIFQSLGVPVFVSDIVAKELMESDSEIQKKIIQLLGTESYFSDGSLNRKYIATLVFSDEQLLHSLNSIVHPATEDLYKEWCERYSNEVYTVKEAAILFESGTYKSCDQILTVACKSDTALKRAMKRDGSSLDQVQKRLSNQMSQDEKISRSNYVIWNDDDCMILSEVIKIHEMLLKK